MELNFFVQVFNIYAKLKFSFSPSTLECRCTLTSVHHKVFSFQIELSPSQTHTLTFATEKEIAKYEVNILDMDLL